MDLISSIIVDREQKTSEERTSIDGTKTGGVTVDRGIERAIVMLKRQLDRDGIHRVIKLRLAYPNLRDREKAKARLATWRRAKAEQKRERYRGVKE